MTTTTRLILLAVVVVAMLGSCACADSYYRAMMWNLDGSYTPLRNLAGGTDSCAYGINQYGNATGWSTNRAGVTEAVRWTSDGIIDLGTGVGYSINSRGQVAGESNGKAVMWDANGTKHEIVDGTARGLNNYGQVVGWMDVTNESGISETHGFLWSLSSGLHDLGRPAGTIAVAARAINNNGTIAGATQINPDYGKAFSYNGTTWTQIIDGTAMAINDSGQVVGNTVLGQGFFWSPGSDPVLVGMTARAVNDAGIVAGISYGNNAAIWTVDGGVVELAELDGGYVRSVASAINDDGKIAGWAVYVPEPSSFAALVFGALGLIPAIRRRRSR